MSEFLKDQYKEGQRLYRSMNPKQRNELAFIANAIVAVQRQVTEEMKAAGLEEICASCVDCCCKKTHEVRTLKAEYFTFLEFLMTEEIRKVVEETISLVNMSETCSFLHYSEGCLLPENLRPVICKVWFCPVNSEMDRVRDKFEPILRELFAAFKRGLHE